VGEVTVAERRQERIERAEVKARAKAGRPWFRKKRYWLLGVVAVIVVFAIASGGGDEPTADEPVAQTAEEPASAEEPAAEEPAAEEEETFGIGDEAPDGQLTFVVEDIERGVDQVGDEFFREEPQGKFVIATVAVTNHSDEPWMMSGGDQYAIDSEIRRHAADWEATFANAPDGDMNLEDINPGNTARGEIVFDVPENAKIVELELHDGMFSGGVVVDVRN
jgi:hypothetical protein